MFSVELEHTTRKVIMKQLVNVRSRASVLRWRGRIGKKRLRPTCLGNKFGKLILRVQQSRILPPHDLTENGARKRRKGLKFDLGLADMKKKNQVDKFCLQPMKQTMKVEKGIKNMEYLPTPVLEKVFSYLDWKELGTAMLVCQTWNQIGGHPLLWASFPLHLDVKRLDEVVKIKRLAWVKSLTIYLPKQWIMRSNIIAPVFNHLKRAKEVSVTHNGPGYTYIDRFMKAILKSRGNNITRIFCKGANHIAYFVKSCDEETETFVKNTMKTMGARGFDSCLFNGPPGGFLSFETLKAIATTSSKKLKFWVTNVMIERNINVEKFAELLKHHITWWMCDEISSQSDIENHDMAPIDAILDLLNSKDHGMLELVNFPRNLLMRSNWAKALRGDLEAKPEVQQVVLYRNGSGIAMM